MTILQDVAERLQEEHKRTTDEIVELEQRLATLTRKRQKIKAELDELRAYLETQRA